MYYTCDKQPFTLSLAGPNQLLRMADLEAIIYPLAAMPTPLCAREDSFFASWPPRESWQLCNKACQATPKTVPRGTYHPS